MLNGVKHFFPPRNTPHEMFYAPLCSTMKISEKTQKTRYLIWEAWDKLNLYSNEVFPFSCVPFPVCFNVLIMEEAREGLGMTSQKNFAFISFSLESWNFKRETFKSSVTVTSRYGFQGSGLSSLSLISNIRRKKVFIFHADVCLCLLKITENVSSQRIWESRYEILKAHTTPEALTCSLLTNFLPLTISITQISWHSRNVVV